MEVKLEIKTIKELSKTCCAPFEIMFRDNIIQQYVVGEDCYAKLVIDGWKVNFCPSCGAKITVIRS